MGFGEVFKKFLLRSQFAKLSEFGNALAERGYLLDDSTFSRWQHGNRIPKSRTLLLLILQMFIQRSGITSLADANAFLESAGQGYLTQSEMTHISLSASSPIPFQSPQRIAYFTGRSSCIQTVRTLLREHKTVLIYGPPGIGKTALTITVTHRLRNEYPDGILWYRLDTSSVMDILATIAYTYGESVNHIKNAENRASTVRSLLAQKKFLMIFDNAEPHHDLRLLLPNSPSASVLITSRYKNLHNLPSYKPVGLEAFTDAESLALCKKILGSTYVKRNRQKLITVNKLIGNLPLAVNLTARQLIHVSHDITRIIRQLKKEGLHLEELGYEDKNLANTLNIIYQHLPASVATLFTSLGVFEGQDFSLPAVAFLNGVLTEKIEPVLEYLVNISFVEYSIRGRYRIHPFIKQFIQSEMSSSRVAYEKIATYYARLLARGGRGVTNYYPVIEQELDNILGIFFTCYKRKHYRHIIKLWEYLGVFLWDTGRWNTMKQCGELVCNACLKEGDNHTLALCFLRELCWLHYWQGDIKRAESYIHKGIKLAKTLKDDTLLALAWTRLGKVYLSKRRASKALLFFQRALVYFRKMRNREKQGDIFTYIGETYWLMGQRNRAKYYLRHALRIVNTIHDIPQKITIISRLGCIALQEKHLDQAITYFKKSLLLEQESGRRVGDTFWNNLALGLAYEMENKYEAAKEKFQLAKEEMALINFTEKIFQTDVFPMIFKKELARSKWYPSPSRSSEKTL